MAQARTPLRLVLDTNVVASALLWSGSPRILLQAAREKRIQLFTSPPMLAELGDILARPKFARKIEASLLGRRLRGLDGRGQARGDPTHRP